MHCRDGDGWSTHRRLHRLPPRDSRHWVGPWCWMVLVCAGGYGTWPENKGALRVCGGFSIFRRDLFRFHKNGNLAFEFAEHSLRATYRRDGGETSSGQTFEHEKTRKFHAKFHAESHRYPDQCHASHSVNSNEQSVCSLSIFHSVVVSSKKDARKASEAPVFIGQVNPIFGRFVVSSFFSSSKIEDEPTVPMPPAMRTPRFFQATMSM